MIDRTGLYQSEGDGPHQPRRQWQRDVPDVQLVLHQPRPVQPTGLHAAAGQRAAGLPAEHGHQPAGRRRDGGGRGGQRPRQLAARRDRHGRAGAGQRRHPVHPDRGDGRHRHHGDGDGHDERQRHRRVHRPDSQPDRHGDTLVATGTSRPCRRHHRVRDKPALQHHPLSDGVVTSTQDDGSQGTLRSVLANVPPGATVTFLPSRLPAHNSTPADQHHRPRGEIDIPQSVTIVGPPARRRRQRPERQPRVRRHGRPRRMSDLTILEWAGALLRLGRRRRPLLRPGRRRRRQRQRRPRR